jgi:phospholipid:diacylglycerol acyltransferase
MMRALVLDKEEWKRHIMLDQNTGLDPPGIKLRAAQGFDATDFFITGYWIWNKILENLVSTYRLQVMLCLIVDLLCTGNHWL